MKRSVLAILSAALLVPAVLGTASPAQAAPSVGSRLGAPSGTTLPRVDNFSGRRDTAHATDILTWNASSQVSFYVLRAESHQTHAPLTITSQASQIPGNWSSFTAGGPAITEPGGTDYYLRACNQSGVCGLESVTTVLH